ncbi:nucleoside-diphosphate kinase [Streptomyces sp. NPDC127069]|uniref:nucleoside-diphosphate kinase n=1 Tax=Streptomyces sp. NPDC127069 TaxID=3347128 RepID=UPI003666BA2F
MPEPDRLALLVIKPDGVAQHLTRLISLWMRDHGYQLRAFRELILTPERQALLYANSQTAGPIDQELHAVLYTLGPVHTLLLERKTGRTAGGLSAAELAHRLTGDFLPHRARPGTLRSDFGALNPVLNLIHATDHPENLDRDARALFDRPLAGLLGPGGATPDGIAQTPHLLRPFKLWSTVAGVLSAWLGPETVRPIDWPADTHGPSGPAVGAALMACTRAAQRAGNEAGTLLTGVLDGSTSYPHFTSLVPNTDPWPGYLTYTTLRHLNLCADTP